jgi:hypothetical protein
MPYETVTVEMFRARFPIFDDSPDEQVQLILDEAHNNVGQTWKETDYQPAILYLTAHLLATDASQEGDSVGVGSVGGGAIASESFGGMSISYNTTSGSANSGAVRAFYDTTEYGRRYYRIMKNNFGGPVAV